MAATGHRPEHRCHADHRRRPAHQVPSPLLVIGAAAGTILIVSGLTFEFATLLTPYFDRVARGGFGGSAGPSGAAAWFAAVLLGAVFLGVGAARLAGLLADVRSNASAKSVICRPGTPTSP